MSAKIIHSIGKLRKFDDGTFRLDDVRISYPKLFAKQLKPMKDSVTKAVVIDNATGKPKLEAWGGTFIAPLDTHKAEMVYLRKKALELAADKLPKIKTAIGDVPVKLGADKLYLRDGNNSQKNPEYHGAWIIVAKDQRARPDLYDGGGMKVSEDTYMSLFTAGFRVSIVIRPWILQADSDKRIAARCGANLLVVRFMRKDAPLSIADVRPDADDVFADFEAPTDVEGDGLGDDGLGDPLNDPL